jgi:hypothetical protein
MELLGEACVTTVNHAEHVYPEIFGIESICQRDGMLHRQLQRAEDLGRPESVLSAEFDQIFRI